MNTPGRVRPVHRCLRHQPGRSRTAQRCRSITRAASPASSSTRTRSRCSTTRLRSSLRTRSKANRNGSSAGGANVEAVVGTEKRLRLVARDLVEHFESRVVGMDGKAMIVCMSRRICVALYGEIVRLRPDWHSDDDDRGVIKIVMTGAASDPQQWQRHIGGKARRELLAKRIKDPDDALKLAIVRDMWLTGFDAPSLHTMYVDKPMRGHGLMQAIARVNRVFRDKPAGLIVDYIGIAQNLKSALGQYSRDDRKHARN